MRRFISLLSIAAALSLALLGGVASLAAAQESTPAATPVAAFSGLPQVNVTITDSAINVYDAQLPAGYVVLSVTNNTQEETGAGILGPGPGETMDQLQQEAATPTADNSIPAFLYKATIVGGPGDIPPGETRQQVVNVPAGEWVVFGEGSQPPTPITAIETADSVTTAPTADVQITESNFLFSGLNAVPAGQQVWEVTNTGDQPHMLVLAKVPDGTSVDDVLSVVMQPENATPTPGTLQVSDFQDVTGDVILQSQGQSVFVPLDLDAGTYVAACFVNDPATGQLHAMEGMVSVFQVGGSGTPAA